ncbi:hypothetical protein C1H46_025412 [Malus baccata]|uniref:Peptidase C1A papain C-terminal domain-containing protein n=1 Tax=Malus baccata TaxID=106549 RepID=A0A540LRA4_MALBA|nr:hypothetical protein C1H46_025412 [Malus baccata]
MRIPVNNEKILQAVVAHQPVSVAIDASSYAFQLYSLSSLVIGEISTMESPQSGYGEDSGKKYWLVKISWGLDGGASGYARMKHKSVDKEGT